MFEWFIVIVGLIIGIILFYLIFKKLRPIFCSFYGIAFLFIVCVSIGIGLAWLFRWVMVVVAILLIIALIYTLLEE